MVADVTSLPSLFGVSIYSFMCHHSLPSLLTPMSRKSKLNTVLLADLSLILGFYCLLCFTATFRFARKRLPSWPKLQGALTCNAHVAGSLKDLYTLNFKNFKSEFVSYYLGLFPVFTLRLWALYPASCPALTDRCACAVLTSRSSPSRSETT